MAGKSTGLETFPSPGGKKRTTRAYSVYIDGDGKELHGFADTSKAGWNSTKDGTPLCWLYVVDAVTGVRCRDPMQVADAAALETCLGHLVKAGLAGDGPFTFMLQKGEPGAWENVLETSAAYLRELAPDHLWLGALARFSSSYDTAHCAAAVVGGVGFAVGAVGGFLGAFGWGWRTAADSAARKFKRLYYHSYLAVAAPGCGHKLVRMSDKSPRLLRVGEVEVRRQGPYGELSRAFAKPGVQDCDTGRGQGVLITAAAFTLVADRLEAPPPTC